MKKNVGFFDRVIRLVIAAGLFALAAIHVVPGYWNIITWCAAGIVLVTAVLGICPLYGACGFDSRNHKEPGDVYK